MRTGVKLAKDRTPAPSRRQALDAAAKAVEKGKLKDAVAQYVAVMAREGADPTLHAKVAALHVRLRQPAQARDHFDAAATHYLRQGFEDKALAVYRSAVASLPHEVAFWEAIARHHRERRCDAEAVKTLLEARGHFTRKATRAQAIRLLQAAIAIEPWHFEATFDLAQLLGREGDVAQARELYLGVAERMHGVRLRRVRAALFRLSPSPGTAWRWLRAALLGR